MQITIFGYTFGTKQKRTRKSSIGHSSKAWTDEDIHKLISMHEAGKTQVGMARMLGRTKPAIAAKLWKIKNASKNL